MIAPNRDNGNGFRASDCKIAEYNIFSALLFFTLLYFVDCFAGNTRKCCFKCVSGEDIAKNGNKKRASRPSCARYTGRLVLLCGSCWGVLSISIHALREEGDFDSVYVLLSRCIFLSTPSARRATVIVVHSVVLSVISIHALREEGDSSTTRHQSPGC